MVSYCFVKFLTFFVGIYKLPDDRLDEFVLSMLGSSITPHGGVGSIELGSLCMALCHVTLLKRSDLSACLARSLNIHGVVTSSSDFPPFGAFSLANIFVHSLT